MIPTRPAAGGEGLLAAVAQPVAAAPTTVLVVAVAHVAVRRNMEAVQIV
jgi:hypothetical protein